MMSYGHGFILKVARRLSIFDKLLFNNSFVQLKINVQALDSAPVSQGEVFKVDGSKDSI